MSLPVRASTNVTAAQLNGLEKAATLMVILGEQTSADVFRQLDEAEIQRIGRAIASIPTITSEIAEEVLTEFYQMIVAQDYVLKGGLDYARSVLVSAFGIDKAHRLIDRLASGIVEQSATFDTLQRADPQQLANFLHNEHPQTVALVLSHLNTKQAAALLQSLPDELRDDIAIRMATLDQISPEVISRIASVISDKLQALGQTSREAYGGARAVAAIFNSIDQKDSKALLGRIEANHADLSEQIRRLMFVFEDLIRVEARGIRELLERVDRKVLTVALKGTSETLRNHFLQYMSQRAADMLREDMEALGPTRMRDVENAQQQVIAAARVLESEGVINLSDSDSDQYVS
jgi:flagellar motor switch protein FliG